MGKDEKERTRTEPGGPGAALREARESAGLTIEQVADRLHLLQSVVSSLEQDCYDRIRGDTFVRGYLRNYARLLGIDGDEIVARYRAAERTGKGEGRGATRRRDVAHGSSGASRIGMVLVLLAASALFLFHNREPQAAVPETGTASVTIETAKGATVVPLLAPAAP
jgi:cytoskeleton protein RodZ